MLMFSTSKISEIDGGDFNRFPQGGSDFKCFSSSEIRSLSTYPQALLLLLDINIRFLILGVEESAGQFVDYLKE